MGVSNTDLPTLQAMNQGVTVYDNKDRYVCTLRDRLDRKAIPLSKISIDLQNAVIASEDRRFYQHPGIDPWGIMRAFWTNCQAGRIVEGGSTITQQVVRNLYLDPQNRSYSRKFKEAFMAMDVENHYSKKKILETYLNVAYFGGGVCGAERASQHYFGKSASDLSVAESAYLAGLVKAPSDLSRKSNLDAAVSRQKEIIAKMEEYGLLSPSDKQKANSEKLAFKLGQTSRPWPHYIGYVEDELRKELGESLWKRGWKVYTNLDVEAQTQAEKALNRGVAGAPKGVDQGALVTMSLKDGAVLAVVGGAGTYEDTQWNRALHPHTAGSVFKPFVYLAGLSRGVIQPDTLINDGELTIEQPNSKPYKPQNYDGKFGDWLSARSALAFSRNVCSVRVAMATGLGNVIDMAHAAGIHSQLDAYPSLALGCCAVTPLEMATAYASLGRGGVYMAPRAVRRIDNDRGEPYRQFAATASTNLPTEQTVQLVDVLQDVVRFGTGTRAAIPGVAVAGKTGTSNDSKDIWFVGLTPDVVTAVWAGNDLNKPVKGVRVTGGAVMAKIWHDYMLSYLKTHKPENISFAKPAVKLIATMPNYTDDELLATGVDRTTAMCYNDPAALVAAQVDKTDLLNQIEQRGVARAYDIQKVKVIKRLRQSYVAAAQTGSLATVVGKTEEGLLPSREPRSVEPNSAPEVAPDRAQWRSNYAPFVNPERLRDGWTSSYRSQPVHLERIPAPAEHASSSGYWQRSHPVAVSQDSSALAEVVRHSQHKGVQIIKDVAGEGDQITQSDGVIYLH